VPHQRQCQSTDFNIRPRNGPPGAAKRNSTSPSSWGPAGSRAPASRADLAAAGAASLPPQSEVRSTVETQPKEQIATIRRPTCALMEKLKITTGLPLDHSTDSLVPSRLSGGVFVDYVNKLAPIAPALAVSSGCPHRQTRPETLRPRSIVIFSHYAP